MGMVGRAPEFNASGAVCRYLRPQLGDQHGFSDTRFTTNEHDLSHARLGLLPAAAQQATLGLAADEASPACQHDFAQPFATP